MVDYWTLVEIVYIIDIIIFGFLAAYFWNIRRKTINPSAKFVITSMGVLTTVLFFQELYFGLNLFTDPAKLGIASKLFPTINSIWIFAKLMLTIGGIGIILTIFLIKKQQK